MSNISLFPHIKVAKNGADIPIDLFLDGIRSGKWQDQVLAIHAIGDDQARRTAKERLPYVTVSGTFSERNNAGLLAHSGFICIDIDKVDNVARVRDLLTQDRFVYSVFVSASGKGLAVIFKITPEKHRESFDGLAEYFHTNYRLIVDQNCKDVSRPRYVSYDPAIHVNEGAQKFTQYPVKENKALTKAPEVVFVRADFDQIVNEIVTRRVDITGDYRQWVKTCFAFVDKLGEAGRSYFHAVSQFSSMYDYAYCDRQFDNCLKAKGSGRVTIASFYYLAKEAGIEVMSERTKLISKTAVAQKKAGIPKEGIIKHLEQFDGILPEDSADIVGQVLDHNIQVKESTDIDAGAAFIRKNYDLKRNEITRKIENYGAVLDENGIDKVMLAIARTLPKMSYTTMQKLIFSEVPVSYNPIKDFFTAYEDRHPVGSIAALIGTIQTDTGMEADNFCPDYAERFFTKWLVGVVAAVYDNNHNDLQLVLIGAQNSGKTSWLRGMLPAGLSGFFGESKLDRGKDDELLMCEKLIVMDDEMSGKSKQEAKFMKEILSKKTFSLRAPYARGNQDYRRLASLCGTSNPDDILNDPTGNRRIIPLHVISVNFEAYNELDKIDPLMEAYRLYRNGFDWRLTQDDIKILNENTGRFEQVNAEYELIARLYSKPDSQAPGGNNVFVTTTDIKAEIERVTGQKVTTTRLGIEMKKMGFMATTARVGGMPLKGYYVISRGVVR
jgi:predicted P-loop ATPase